MASNAQRSSLTGVHHKRLVVEAHGTLTEQPVGDDMISSAWRHAAVHKRTGECSSVLRRRFRKHMGKTIKQYHYLPMLDDRNLNDQGIDAAGNRASEYTATVTISGFSRIGGFGSQYDVGITDLDGDLKTETGTEHVSVKITNPKLMSESSFTATDAVEATAISAAWDKAYTNFYGRGLTGAADTAAFMAEAYSYDTNGANGWDNVTQYKFSSFEETTQASGNIYGSTKDVGTISGKLPVLSEHGGRVNRVGFKRIVIEGQIEKFGLTPVALAA